MDEQIRALERKASRGDRDAALRLERVRERASAAGGLFAALEAVAARISAIRARTDRIERFVKTHPTRDVPLPWYGGMRADQNPFTAEASLRRRWRLYYRAWLRETGKRVIIDAWQTTPSPVCSDPKHGEHGGNPWTPCAERRTIVLLPGPKHSWAKNEEWSHNNRLIDRARKWRAAHPDAAVPM